MDKCVGGGGNGSAFTFVAAGQGDSVCGEGKKGSARGKGVKNNNAVQRALQAVNGRARGKGKEQDLASEATSGEGERAGQTKPRAAFTQQNKEERCIMGVGSHAPPPPPLTLTPCWMRGRARRSHLNATAR